MFIKKRIEIYALHIYGRKPSTSTEVLYFKTKPEALHYQQAHYQRTPSEVKTLDAIEINGQLKHFHYKPSAAKHRFGAYILDDRLRLAILQQDEWVVVGLNRPYPNQRIAGSPAAFKDVRHFIWAGKCKNELIVKDAKLLNKPIVFTNQHSLRSL